MAHPNHCTLVKVVERLWTFYFSFVDSPEEGEIQVPKRRKIPQRSPPPEDEWAPCIRMLVSESSSLTKGTLYVVMQDGANIGR